jgi:hypothetical protein
LVFDADRAEDEDFRRLLDRLGSRALKKGIGGLLGYDASHTGDETRLAI